MKEDSRVLDIIVEELTEAKNKHAVPRRTLIKPDEGEALSFPLEYWKQMLLVVVVGGGGGGKMVL